jgi:hypothetical protein
MICGDNTVPGINEEHFLLVKRVLQFHNIWTVYFDFLSGRYVPSVGWKQVDETTEVDTTITTEMGPTLMFLLHAFFYSLIEDSDGGLDAFRIWKKKFPEEVPAISALEKEIAPLRADLRTFRHKFGFHGSRSFQQESKRLDLFGNHSPAKLIEAMKCFMAFNAALLAKDKARQQDSSELLGKARLRIDSVAARALSIGKM